jgi:hypothetical protein
MGHTRIVTKKWGADGEVAVLNFLADLSWYSLAPLAVLYCIYRLALKYRNSNSFRFLDGIPGIFLTASKKIHGCFRPDIPSDDYLEDEFKGPLWRTKFRLTRAAVDRLDGLY